MNSFVEVQIPYERCNIRISCRRSFIGSFGSNLKIHVRIWTDVLMHEKEHRVLLFFESGKNTRETEMTRVDVTKGDNGGDKWSNLIMKKFTHYVSPCLPRTSAGMWVADLIKFGVSGSIIASVVTEFVVICPVSCHVVEKYNYRRCSFLFIVKVLISFFFAK